MDFIIYVVANLALIQCVSLAVVTIATGHYIFID